MSEPSPEELDRLHTQIATLMGQAKSVFDAVGLTPEEKSWANETSQNLARIAISQWTELRHQQPRPKVRMLALSVAVASALAIVDANARATDAFTID